MDWYLGAFKKYAVFEGRARRKEYWMFVLFNIIVSIVLAIIDILIGSGGILGGLYLLAVFIPSISVCVRRLHDTNRSGWWWWIWLVPIVGGIILLVFMVLEGTNGSNDYGADPKA